jgi:hypothetical protein
MSTLRSRLADAAPGLAASQLTSTNAQTSACRFRERLICLSQDSGGLTRESRRGLRASEMVLSGSNLYRCYVRGA